MRLCELREMEVINLCSCRKLGNVMDLCLNLHKGCIEAIIVPVPGKWHGLFGCDTEYEIPFECIKKIGKDIIMVEINEEKCLKRCKDS